MFFVTSVAEDPRGETVCATQWNKFQLFMHFVYKRCIIVKQQKVIILILSVDNRYTVVI